MESGCFVVEHIMLHFRLLLSGAELIPLYLWLSITVRSQSLGNVYFMANNIIPIIGFLLSFALTPFITVTTVCLG